MKKKYGYLLDDKNVNRWYENVARGSRVTANIYLRRLGRFCESNNTTPQELIKLNERKISDLLLDTVTHMETKKYAGSYIVSVLKGIKSWLAFNDIQIRRRIKVKGANQTPSLKNERVPTQPELKKIFLSGDLKTRVACVLVAHSGLRIQALGNYDGTDGLRIKDFPELEMNAGVVEFEKIPTMIIVRPNLSKSRKQYFSFLSAEGCEYLKAYLEMRMRKAERLTKESAIVTPKTAKKEFIRSINVGDAIRNAIRKAGLPWRPYVLRGYFDTQLMVAESKGLIIRDFRVFFMGHKGDIEATYTLRKTLSSDIIEEMREKYKQSQRYLQTIETGKDEEDIKKMFKKQLMLVAGFKPEEIKDEDLEGSDEEFQRLVRNKLIGGVKNNGARQKLVRLNEMEPYLQDGWEFVALLPNRKVVLKHPIGF